MLLQVLAMAPDGADLSVEQLERIASALEQLSAEHHGCAAHQGHGRFTLVLCDVGEGQAPALLGALAEALHPLRLVAGIVAVPPQADRQARLSALAAVDQALDIAKARGVSWHLGQAQV